LKKSSGHSSASQNSPSDRALGLDRDITRRDFLNSTLLASGGLLLNAASPAELLAQQAGAIPAENDWTGYGGIGDYSASNGTRGAVFGSVPRIRVPARQQFTDMFARSGFDPKNDIAGIILNRWGHAYLTPLPGFFFGKDGKSAPGNLLRAAPFGRIAFANTDLSGVADHRSSIIEANRAVGQLLDQVLS
jgi:hypothetical protein